MSIELTFRFASIDNAKSFMAGLGKKSKEALESEPVASAPSAAPVDLSGGPAEEAVAANAAAAAPAPGTAATETAASDIAGMLGIGGAPAAPAPAAAAPAPTAAAPAAPVAPPVAPPPAPAAPAAPPVVEQPVAPPAPQPQGAIEQKNVIAAFTALGQAKGRDAIAGLLQELGVSTVIEIPAANYVPVLNRINQLLNS